MLAIFKQAKTYAVAFLIATLWIVISTINIKLGIKIFCMMTYYIGINKLLIKGGILRRLIWNLIFSLSGAAILFYLDKSISAIALEIISKELNLVVKY